MEMPAITDVWQDSLLAAERMGKSMAEITYTQIDMILTGKRIQDVIRENGYSVRELQELLNLSCPQPVYRWMKGKALPTVDHLYMMHRLFDMHMEDMIVAKGENIK